MHVAIIGTGKVGATLARRFVDAGHEVTLGSREPDRADVVQLADEVGATAARAAEAVRNAAVAVLALPSMVVAEVAAGLVDDLGACVLVDATNPVRWEDGPVHDHETSNGEAVAAAAPGVAVVKAFNTMGIEIMADPIVAGRPSDLHLAGDDADAKRLVGELGASIGFEPLDCGPLRNARVTEHLGVLWIHLAVAGGQGREFGFKRVTRDPAVQR